MKARGVPRTDPALVQMDKSASAQVLRILQDNSENEIGQRVRTYQSLLERYIQREISLGPLREFVSETFQPEFIGKERFLRDIAQVRGFLVTTHDVHTPDIDSAAWQEDRVHDDFGTTVTALGMATALEGTGIGVSRLVNTPNHTEAYRQAMSEVGNVILSDQGTDNIASQVREIMASGNIAEISPEGGFRGLKKWNSGAVVLAVKAGLERMHLVAHNPLVSLFAPEMRFDYVGTREIPPSVAEAVKASDREPVQRFAYELRGDLAAAIQLLPYPQVYKQQVAQYARRDY